MLFSAWIILGSVGTVVAAPRQGTDVLTISLKGPAASVASIDDIKLTAHVRNTGFDTIKVLKYGTILDADNPTRSFVVTKNGTDVQFTGVQPMISLEYLDDSAFMVIPPGQAVTVVHSVAPLYDFAAAGPGLFTFEPVTSFQLVAAANQSRRPSFLKASAGESIVVEVTKDVATRHLVSEDKRAVNICGNLQKRAFISASYIEAKVLARQAIDYITIRGAGDPLYRSYWGNNDVNVVRNVFSLVELENSITRTLQCGDALNLCVRNNWVAYTQFPSTNIFYCDVFYMQVPTDRLCKDTPVLSRNIRGGTTLHEITHATARTTDVTYGCLQDQYLTDPDKIRNADNFNCFATDVFATTVCRQ